MEETTLRLLAHPPPLNQLAIGANGTVATAAAVYAVIADGRVRITHEEDDQWCQETAVAIGFGREGMSWVLLQGG